MAVGKRSVFRLARHKRFVKQEWILLSSIVLKNVKQRSQTELLSVSLL